VFTLDYHVDSPINTIFTPYSMQQYLKMFNFLWRLKRVEHSLSAAWRGLVTSGRQYNSIPELAKDIRSAQIVVTSMIHFTSQLQYYYLFEVRWALPMCMCERERCVGKLLICIEHLGPGMLVGGTVKLHRQQMYRP
jgi:hypothetical protein